MKDEQEPLPSIKEVNKAAFYLKNKYMKEDERKAEDLNDKKAAWLSVALEKGIKNLNSRDKAFAEQYLKENVHYSMHFMFKEWLPKFIEQQRVRYGLK
jgi:hypothetical protein